MKFNLFLEADDEEEDKKKHDEEEDKDDDKDMEDNDYLDDDHDKDDDEDMEDNDYLDDGDKEDDSFDDSNDYLGDSNDTGSDTGLGEEGSGDLSNKLAKVAYACCVVANNMKHVHLHIAGKKFDNIHSLSETYYQTIGYWVDSYAELALEDKSGKVDNLSNSAQHVAEISLETEDKYDYESACTAISSNLRQLLEILKNCRESASSRSDIESKIDDNLGYLNKELNYTMERRQAVGEGFSFEIK